MVQRTGPRRRVRRNFYPAVASPKSRGEHLGYVRLLVEMISTYERPILSLRLYVDKCIYMQCRSNNLFKICIKFSAVNASSWILENCFLSVYEKFFGIVILFD